jgi:pimeloyl-ACP methyl ester carboxylesterase
MSLENSFSGESGSWGWVHPRIVQTTRVLAYDRAGIGWSDPGAAPRDGEHIPTERIMRVFNGLSQVGLLRLANPAALFAPRSRTRSCEPIPLTVSRVRPRRKCP